MGGGIGMGNTCKPMAVSFQCMTKFTTNKKKLKKKYWSGLPFPPPGDLSNPGIKPTSLALAGGFFLLLRDQGSLLLSTYYIFNYVAGVWDTMTHQLS